MKNVSTRQALPTWSHQDLRFVAETLVPERGDPENVVNLLQGDDALLGAMLQDDRLFQELMTDDEIFVTVSPEFFFKILLVRARRDLEQELYTIERRHLQMVVLFDANRVVDLLARPDLVDYLATMLASFTRVNSSVVPVRIRKGIWRRIRVNDLDVDSLVHYANILKPEHRFDSYRRIGDACLFLTGIFPEYIETQQRYPHSNQPRLRSTLLQSLEDYEAYGRTFYRLAANHETAATQALDEMMTTLSEQFILAEKPLAFITERYLSMRKHNLFEI